MPALRCSSAVVLVVLLGALLGGTSRAASGKAITCTASKAVSAGVTIRYTQIKATNVGCLRAHQILKAFAKGPTELNTYLGFVCLKSGTHVANTFVIRCKQQQRAAISALQTRA